MFNLKQLKTLGSEEMLIQSLIGKVAERLKDSSKDARPFHRKKEKLIRAGNIVIDMIKEGHIVERKEITKEHEKWKTFTYVRIVGGKSKTKDLSRGFHKEPGRVNQNTIRNYRLRSDDKEILRTLSSIKFHRSKYADEVYLWENISLVKQDPKSREIGWKKEARLKRNLEAALDKEKFFLSYKYDGRGRIYPEGMSIMGFNPHGKAHETMAFEITPRPLTEEGREVLRNLHPYEGHLKDLREPQLEEALTTGVTGMLVEGDITNSGLLIAGLLFKSPEMLSATNGYGGDTQADSHSIFGKVYGFSRETAKQIHTPLLHGASCQSVSNKVSELTGTPLTKEEVYVNNEKAYGEAIHNIYEIAQYGRRVMSNTRSEVSWTLPDGFRATHRAYTEHVPLELQLRDRKVKIMAEMPLLLDGRGIPVYDKDVSGATHNTNSKLVGLYANIVHSVDAFVMREVIRSGVMLLPKHDAFLVHPNDVSKLRKTLQEIYSDLFEKDLLRNILNQIEESTGVKAPELYYGKAENRMKESNFFLKVE